MLQGIHPLGPVPFTEHQLLLSLSEQGDFVDRTVGRRRHAGQQDFEMIRDPGDRLCVEEVCLVKKDAFEAVANRDDAQG